MKGGMNTPMVKISYDQYDEILMVFDTMMFKAHEFTPMFSDLYKIKEDFENGLGTEHVLFLLWIEETGNETEENKKERHFLKSIIKEHIEITDKKNIATNKRIKV